MSDMECVHGTYKRVSKSKDITLDEFNKIKDEYNIKYAQVDFKDRLIVRIYDRTNQCVWLHWKKELWVAIEQENIDIEDGYLRCQKLEENVYKIETYFYNGGGSFDELLDDGIEIADK